MKRNCIDCNKKDDKVFQKKERTVTMAREEKNLQPSVEILPRYNELHSGLNRSNNNRCFILSVSKFGKTHLMNKLLFQNKKEYALL